MNWSLPDYTAPLDGDEIFYQMCGRNGLVIALVGKSGRDEGNGMVVAERKGMVESSFFDPHENAVEINESIIHRTGCEVGCKESDVNGSRRAVNGTGSDVRCSVRDVDVSREFSNPVVGVSRLILLTQSSKLLVSHGRSSLHTISQEEN